MGPAPDGAEAPAATVYTAALGANVVDADGNRYVDFAAGFGALLLGHSAPEIVSAIRRQSERLLVALGDVFPSDVKADLVQRLAALYPKPGARVILGQTGADAVTAAMKAAVLGTGRPGVIAFRGSYHGLSYAPLAASSLRDGYRAPFAAQLNPHVRFVEYPATSEAADRALIEVDGLLRSTDVGAVLVEPILGRGGVVVPPPGFAASLGRLVHERDALIIADEIWTGLGRSGSLLLSVAEGMDPDLVCLGKGLGGGVPVSACIGSDDVMEAWRRDDEVVHTSTFAGAPLACGAAMAMLDALQRRGLVARSAALGERFLGALRTALGDVPGVAGVRGRGLMVGIDLGPRPGCASIAMQHLLGLGYIVSTGGGAREVVVLTPPLCIAEELLWGFVPRLAETLRGLSP